MFDASCEVTCRKTDAVYTFKFYSLQRVLILSFYLSLILSSSLTITSYNTNFVYIYRYKVGDRTDLPSTKLPPTLQKGLQWMRFSLLDLHPLRILCIGPKYRYLPETAFYTFVNKYSYWIFRYMLQNLRFFVNKVPFISCHLFWFIKYSHVTSMTR